MNLKIKILITLLGLAVFNTQAFSQHKLLQSGPMVGYSQMFEVMLWAQTNSACQVSVKYFDLDSAQVVYYTNTVQTQKETAFTAKLIADKVKPGKKYGYQLLINNKPVNLPYKTEFKTLPVWKWRGDAPDFSFATGSCAYINDAPYDRPGKPYGGDYQIFTNIYKTSPDFMLWLGDNIYLREADWYSRTGILYRNTHTRSLPELQPLLASVHHYAIWDDHDFGPNDSDKGYYFKNLTLEAFELFWPNPGFGIEGTKGAFSFFNWNDVDFFMLDNRYYRVANDIIDDNKTMLGKEQLDWFLNALVSSGANYKVVVLGGQFLNPEVRFENYVNYGFAKERELIIDFIHKHQIKGVVFITGDRHYTELSKLSKPGFPDIYDLTVSPLTSSVSGNTDNKANTLAVEGTFVHTRNFAKISVTGPKNDRKFQMQLFDANGLLLWDKTILNK